MALCDDPLAVSTGQAWEALAPRQRVPIFITCNDLGCLYAVRVFTPHPGSFPPILFHHPTPPHPPDPAWPPVE